MEHYRCHKAQIPSTRAERISDTVEFPPKTFNMPNMSSKDATFHAAQYLIYVLQNPAPESPLVKPIYWHKEALRTLAEIFRKFSLPESQMKIVSHSKPFIYEEPLRVPM